MNLLRIASDMEQKTFLGRGTTVVPRRPEPDNKQADAAVRAVMGCDFVGGRDDVWMGVRDGRFAEAV